MKERRWLVGWRSRTGNHEAYGVKGADAWEAANKVREHAEWHHLQVGTEWMRVIDWTWGAQKEMESAGMKGALRWPE
jgi:hypothetical protein